MVTFSLLAIKMYFRLESEILNLTSKAFHLPVRSGICTVKHSKMLCESMARLVIQRAVVVVQLVEQSLPICGSNPVIVNIIK